jgi:hypothetical protein
MNGFVKQVLSKQGDQIGRIIAQCAIVSFGQFYENYVQNWDTFFGHFLSRLRYALIFDQNVLAKCIGGDFFTNSSGHPVSNMNIVAEKRQIY